MGILISLYDYKCCETYHVFAYTLIARFILHVWEVFVEASWKCAECTI